jgi:hypothetical protein
MFQNHLPKYERAEGQLEAKSAAERALANQLDARMEAALFIHFVVEGISLPKGAWR